MSEILDLNTVQHNDVHSEEWVKDSNNKNSRLLLMASQDAAGKIHFYNVPIGKDFILDRLKQIVSQLEKQK